MAHYAIINSDTNTVEQVITGVDEDITQIDLDGTVIGGSTEAWEEFYASQFPGHYVRRTSYNNSIRKRYAGIGMIYSAEHDAFIRPTFFESWIFNEETCAWVAPLPYPPDFPEQLYYWSEELYNHTDGKEGWVKH